jgi:hypothetical protein
MLTDSLLDFLHLYSSPAVLFNASGELLFTNPAAQLCEGTKLSTVTQLQTAIFRGSPVIPLQVQTTFNQHHIQQQSKQSNEEEEYDFSFSANNHTDGRSSFDSTSSSSTSSSSSSTSTAIGSTSPPPTARPSSYQKSSRPSSSSSSSSRHNQSLDRSRRNERFPGSKATNIGGGGGGGDDGSNATSRDSSWQKGEDMSTPIGQIKESTITWKLTRTKCKRVVALAQDMPSSSQGTIPIMSENETNLQRGIVPIIQGSWESQSRFESMKRGGGIMGEKIRHFDWNNHPLGPIASWPQARVEMVGLMLRSPVPMTAYLEHEGFCLYNDAYIAVLGQTKHTSGGEASIHSAAIQQLTASHPD